ncbi:MAG: amidinotransferase [Flavobacteriales bacterium]|nr:amidinotransferase [Flavobacteriales bacterium]
MQIEVRDEFGVLEVVVLGTAKSVGPDPTLEEAYDPKSKQHILAGTYPQEADLVPEMEGMSEVLKKHGVKVIRPEVIQNYNQIFSRDIAFVIDNTFVITQMLEERSREIEALDEVISTIPESQVVRMSGDAYLEGGDVMPHKDMILVGYAKEPDFSDYTVARSNEAGLEFLRKHFPNRTVHAFELNKSDVDPKANALHLDCCFQPLGMGHCIIHPEGFKHQEDVDFLMNLFGKDKCLVISADEMYEMYSNVFSIAPNIVVSGHNFDRLNNWLSDQGYQVEKVKYQEISKMEGLLRCTTLPLKRTY